MGTQLQVIRIKISQLLSTYNFQAWTGIQTLRRCTWLGCSQWSISGANQYTFL